MNSIAMVTGYLVILALGIVAVVYAVTFVGNLWLGLLMERSWKAERLHRNKSCDPARCEFCKAAKPTP